MPLLDSGLRAARLLPLALALPVAAAAQPATPVGSGPAFSIELEVAGEYGGDDLAEIQFTDGSSQTMRAGQGVALLAGARVRPAASSPFSARLAAGFKYQTTAADNANITFTSFPLEAVLAYDLTPDFWMGAGVSYPLLARFRGDGLGPDASFSSVPGATLEAGWRWIGLSYTLQTFRTEGGEDVDGSSVGVVLRWTLR